MTSNLGEVTPLVQTRTNDEWQPVASQSHTYANSGMDMNNNNNNQYASRRRNNNNGFLNHDNDDFPTTNGYEDDEFGSNKDRRTLLVRLRDSLTSLIPIARGGIQARADQCHSRDMATEEHYYEDTYNDESWRCTFGTQEDDGIWLNVHDRVGTIMSSLVWVLVLYSGVTVGLLCQYNNLPPFLCKIYYTLCALALASHAKTSLTDPGSIPQAAVPVDVYTPQAHAMCSRCQSYKPPGTHHCRICDRCISGMDHHCPWMNNCVGTGNLKHFVLFLCYTWTACAFALIMFGWNYFFCADEKCVFSPVLVQLVRVMTLLCIGTLIFTSSMLTNVTYGIMTGVGTIDRLKMKADNTWALADDEPMQLKDIFGVGDYWTWALPFFDPVFEDYDVAMGYSTPQRLLRERA